MQCLHLSLTQPENLWRVLGSLNARSRRFGGFCHSSFNTCNVEHLRHLHIFTFSSKPFTPFTQQAASCDCQQAFGLFTSTSSTFKSFCYAPLTYQLLHCSAEWLEVCGRQIDGWFYLLRPGMTTCSLSFFASISRFLLSLRQMFSLFECQGAVAQDMVPSIKHDDMDAEDGKGILFTCFVSKRLQPQPSGQEVICRLRIVRSP